MFFIFLIVNKLVEILKKIFGKIINFCFYYLIIKKKYICIFKSLNLYMY